MRPSVSGCIAVKRIPSGYQVCFAFPLTLTLTKAIAGDFKSDKLNFKYHICLVFGIMQFVLAPILLQPWKYFRYAFQSL